MRDLNSLLYFAEVVDRGSFAAAGRTLGLPKSTLSRRIAELEATLGARLLQRTTRRLSLTQAGEAYYQHCAALRANVQAADDAVAQVQSEPRGTVRVACPVTLAQVTVAPLLPGFLERHPAVRVEMQVTNRTVDLVGEGIDVALRVRPRLDEQAQLVTRTLGIVRTQLMASPGLLARQGPVTQFDDLHSVATVAMSAVDGRANWLMLGPDDRTVELENRPRLVADDLETLRQAVLCGTGMGVLPEYLCREDLTEGRLQPVLAGWATEPAILHAVFPTRRGLPPAVRAFLDHLYEHVSAGVQRSPGAGQWP